MAGWPTSSSNLFNACTRVCITAMFDKCCFAANQVCTDRSQTSGKRKVCAGHSSYERFPSFVFSCAKGSWSSPGFAHACAVIGRDSQSYVCLRHVAHAQSAHRAMCITKTTASEKKANNASLLIATRLNLEAAGVL
eukprot:3364233-Pleurochrysis_carterae.AAC.1